MLLQLLDAVKEMRCLVIYNEEKPQTQCLLESDHDPDRGHVSDTGRGGQRVRWWPCDDEDPEYSEWLPF